MHYLAKNSIFNRICKEKSFQIGMISAGERGKPGVAGAASEHPQ